MHSSSQSNLHSCVMVGHHHRNNIYLSHSKAFGTFYFPSFGFFFCFAYRPTTLLRLTVCPQCGLHLIIWWGLRQTAGRKMWIDKKQYVKPYRPDLLTKNPKIFLFWLASLWWYNWWFVNELSFGTPDYWWLCFEIFEVWKEDKRITFIICPLYIMHTFGQMCHLTWTD